MARYPSRRELSGPLGQSGRVRKISLPPGFDPKAVQLVASRVIGTTCKNWWRYSVNGLRGYNEEDET